MTMRPFLFFIPIIFLIFIFSSCTQSFYLCYFKEDNLRSVTLNFIEQASQSLDLCVYDISDEEVISLLETKQSNGVRVRICTDDDNPVFMDSASVIYDKDGLMHNKYIIADGRKLWFGSTNLTPTSLENHENNVIITNDQPLISEFKRHFEQCFNGDFKTLRTPVESHLVKFSPEEDCLEMILTALSGAKESVEIAMFAFTDNRIAHYLKILSSKGVKIRIVADREWNLSSIYSDIEELSRYADIRLDGCSGLLHEKFIIVDDRILLTGSYNYTAAAQNKNDEFLFRTTDHSLLEPFRSHFERLWEEGL